MCDISLSIVTYNNKDIIKTTINSIIKHIENNFNYILYVIDNNSTDGTIDEVTSCDGNIAILRNQRT